jgi:glycosyltransferase involved in cell wall biosynthesis
LKRPLILHVITRLEPGGSSRNTVDSCAAQARDFDVVLLAGPHKDGAELRKLLPPEANYIEIRDLQREISPSKDLRALREIKAIIERLRPDIVHTHTSKAGALGRMAAALANLTAEKPALVVHTPHGHLLYGYYGAGRTFIFRLAEKFLARFTDYFVALTPGERRETCEAGIGRPEQWTVIHSGVDFTSAAAEIRRPGPDTGELAIGTVARLEPVKGVEYFIRAAAVLKTRLASKKLRFVVIGGGELETPLRALAHGLGLGDGIIFTGYRADAAALMAGLDIYVQPSLNEAMGRAPLEAQACGIPAVVSAVCGLPDTIREGHTGLSVKPADPAALAAAIERLVLDNGLRAGMGEAARTWALSKDETGFARFGPESMNIRLINFYNKILADGA